MCQKLLESSFFTYLQIVFPLVYSFLCFSFALQKMVLRRRKSWILSWRTNKRTQQQSKHFSLFKICQFLFVNLVPRASCILSDIGTTVQTWPWLLKLRSSMRSCQLFNGSYVDVFLTWSCLIFFGWITRWFSIVVRVKISYVS